MFTIAIGEGEATAEVTFYTAQLYETEFGTDMLADIFGEMKMTDEDAVRSDESGALVSVDFTRVRWLVQLRALWAAVKTHDPRTPGFKKWASEHKGINMWSAIGSMNGEVNDCFFRAAATAEE